MKELCEKYADTGVAENKSENIQKNVKDIKAPK